jgi:hypothetical protein
VENKAFVNQIYVSYAHTSIFLSVANIIPGAIGNGTGFMFVVIFSIKVLEKSAVDI